MALSLYILSPQNKQSLSGTELDLLGRAYDFWSSKWKRIYKLQGSLEFFSSDDFLRLKWIQLYTLNNEVIGFLGHSLFSTLSPSSRQHKYMQFFEPSFIDGLQSQGVQTLLSFEYLLVDPRAYRQGVSRSMAEVMIGNGLKILKEAELDMAIAIARKDNGVADRGDGWGWTHAVTGLVKRNFPVEVMTCAASDVKAHSDLETLSLTNQLWINRNSELDRGEEKLAA